MHFSRRVCAQLLPWSFRCLAIPRASAVLQDRGVFLSYTHRFPKQAASGTPRLTSARGFHAAGTGHLVSGTTVLDTTTGTGHLVCGTTVHPLSGARHCLCGTGHRFSSTYYIDVDHQREVRSTMPGPQPRLPCMMHLMTRGTFYDVGYNVGVAFRDTIQKYYRNCELQMMEFYETPTGQDFFKENVAVCQESFPQYIKELRGLADGCDLSFEHVFMANVFERALLPKDAHQQTSTSTSSIASCDLASDAMGCTALFLVDENNHQYILHNEDAWSESKGGYLLTAEIEEEGFERESFTAFCYPGFLPNWAYGFNHHGLTFNVNAQLPADILRDAPGVKLVMRSLVRARDVPDVIRLAKNAPHGVAYGFTVNVSTRDGQMTSVEVGPGKPEGRVHVYDVSHKGKKPQAPCHYYHFNAYKHLDVEEMPKLFSSSRRRERTQALPPPENLHSGLAVLADTEDQQAPVFRTPRPSDLLETVCTAVFDVTGRQMGVYQGRDNLLENRPVFKFPIP